jgi:uncharacterized protein (TIGR00297 family)
MTETIFAHNTYLALPGRTILGALLALGVAGLAWRAGSLRTSGFLAATVCGTLCAIAGWSWAVLLVCYFVAAIGLSRAGSKEKEASTRNVVSKGGRRDWAQVLANGGVYSIGGALTVIFVAPWLAWAAVGALAAASSDTWATEIGVWVGGEPRSIISRTYVRQGESGGITGAGLMGSVAGAAWVGLVAVALGFPRGLGIASIAAGVGGSLADSLLGATIQERRWCDQCAEPTERVVHLCGCATRRIGGIRCLDNDVVNFLSTLSGFLLGVIFYCIAARAASWGAIG